MKLMKSESELLKEKKGNGTKINYSNKTAEGVEKRDRPRPEMIWRIKEKYRSPLGITHEWYKPGVDS